MSSGPDPDLASRERHLRFHVRLLAGELGVGEDFADEFLPILTQRLRRRWPRADQGVISTAVNDALLIYLRAPRHYDPSRLPLEAFLLLIADRRYRNLHRGILRRLMHEEAVGDALPDLPVGTEEAGSRWRDLRTVLRACRTPTERAYLRARLRGEKRSVALAALLDLAHLDPEAQRLAVYRTWDRLRLRVRRALSPLYLSTQPAREQIG